MSDRDWRNFERTRALLESWGAGDSSASKDLRGLTASDVGVLRRHAHTAGGVAPDGYERPHERSQGLFQDKLKRLAKLGGEDLLVPESPALGGFGYEINGRLYNLDTMKYYEALIALRRGGLLNEMMRATDPRLVVQVGPSWGGLAYQLKTVCPDLTFVLADAPDNLLLAAVYLMNRFPDAQFSFAGPATPSVEWEGPDFIFISRDHLPRIESLPVHLLISVLGFESMTGMEMAAMVDWAHDADCPFVYSLDTRCSGEPEVTAVSILERAYWPHEIPVMPVSFDEMLDGVVRGKTMRAQAQRARRTRPRYRHVIGWRRLAS